MISFVLVNYFVMLKKSKIEPKLFSPEQFEAVFKEMVQDVVKTNHRARKKVIII